MKRIQTLKPMLRTIDTRIAKPPPKVSALHYQSPEHRAWSVEVRRRAKWRCQHPGCTVGYPERLFADHIIEIQDGGAALDPANGQALCGSHHSLKTARHRAERMGS